MKYYAVKKGRKTGVFQTWTEAESQIRGFSNAKFKSFTSLTEAEEYLNDINSDQGGITTEYIAYVDGSFDKKSNSYGSGVVIINNQNVVEEFSFAGMQEEYIESFQIAGEVFAALKAIEWAKQNKIRELTICYDYEGICSWATGEWRTNKSVSKDYKERYDVLSRYVKVYFEKVKAHSGVKFNEDADRLAKRALKNREGVFLEKYNNELYKCLVTVPNDTEKENIIKFDNFAFNEKDILKFIKTFWKSEGGKVGEIKHLSYDLDFNNRLLLVKIETDKINKYEFKF